MLQSSEHVQVKKKIRYLVVYGYYYFFYKVKIANDVQVSPCIYVHRHF